MERVSQLRNSWLPASQMKSTSTLVQQFHSKNPKAPRPVGLMLPMAQQPHKEGIISLTNVLVHNRPIQSHPVHRKQAHDTSLWFSNQLRPRQTTGSSHSHSLTQVSECGNKLNQAWENCTTNSQSGD